MLDLFLWLLVSYGSAVVLAAIANHAVRVITFTDEHASIPILVLLQNSADHVEAAIRSLRRTAWWTGQPIRIVLSDRGSTDDTLQMIQILKRYPFLIAEEAEETDAALIVDLRIQNPQ